LLILVKEMLVGCVLLHKLVLMFLPPSQQKIVLHSTGAAMHDFLGSLNSLLELGAKRSL